MDEPKFRQKHESKEKQKHKGKVYSQKHVRIELENLQRREKNLKLENRD